MAPTPFPAFSYLNRTICGASCCCVPAVLLELLQSILHSLHHSIPSLGEAAFGRQRAELWNAGLNSGKVFFHLLQNRVQGAGKVGKQQEILLHTVEEGWWSQRCQLTRASPRAQSWDTQQLNIAAKGKVLSELNQIYLKQHKTLLPEIIFPTFPRWTFHLFSSGMWSSGSLKHPWAMVGRLDWVGSCKGSAQSLLTPTLIFLMLKCWFFLSFHHLLSPTVSYFHSGFSFFALPAISREALWTLLLGTPVGTETKNKHWGKIKTRASVCDTSPCTLPTSIFSSGAFLTSWFP